MGFHSHGFWPTTTKVCAETEVVPCRHFIPNPNGHRVRFTTCSRYDSQQHLHNNNFIATPSQQQLHNNIFTAATTPACCTVFHPPLTLASCTSPLDFFSLLSPLVVSCLVLSCLVVTCLVWSCLVNYCTAVLSP